MQENLESVILKKLEYTGWTTTRAVVLEAGEEPSAEDLQAAESVMREMAKKGSVTIWTLVPSSGAKELIAAAKPGLELDRELEERGAWATAKRIEVND